MVFVVVWIALDRYVGAVVGGPPESTNSWLTIVYVCNHGPVQVHIEHIICKLLPLPLLHD